MWRDGNSPIQMNIERYKQRLLDKERELLSGIARLEGEARGSGEAEVGDNTDAATSSEGTSESLDEGTLASGTLSEVRDALQRIEAGTYGKCTACGRPCTCSRTRSASR